MEDIALIGWFIAAVVVVAIIVFVIVTYNNLVLLRN